MSLFAELSLELTIGTNRTRSQGRERRKPHTGHSPRFLYHHREEIVGEEEEGGSRGLPSMFPWSEAIPQPLKQPLRARARSAPLSERTLHWGGWRKRRTNNKGPLESRVATGLEKEVAQAGKEGVGVPVSPGSRALQGEGPEPALPLQGHQPLHAGAGLG